MKQDFFEKNIYQNQLFKAKYLLLDRSGNIVKSESSTPLDFLYFLTSLPSGVYFLKVEYEGHSFCNQLIKE
jgi:hypothetical protein